MDEDECEWKSFPHRKNEGGVFTNLFRWRYIIIHEAIYEH